jgi:hypothetical protein
MDFAAASSEEDVLLPYPALAQLQLGQAPSTVASQMPISAAPGVLAPMPRSFRPIQETLRALCRQRMIGARSVSRTDSQGSGGDQGRIAAIHGARVNPQED